MSCHRRYGERPHMWSLVFVQGYGLESAVADINATDLHVTEFGVICDSQRAIAICRAR